MSQTEEEKRMFKFSQVISKEMMSTPLVCSKAMRIISSFYQFDPDDYDTVKDEEVHFFFTMKTLCVMHEASYYDVASHCRQHSCQRNKALVTDHFVKGYINLAFLVTKLDNTDPPRMAVVDVVDDGSCEGAVIAVADWDETTELTLKQGLAMGLMELLHAAIQTKESMMRMFNESNGFLLLKVLMEDKFLWSQSISTCFPSGDGSNDAVGWWRAR